MPSAAATFVFFRMYYMAKPGELRLLFVTVSKNFVTDGNNNSEVTK